MQVFHFLTKQGDEVIEIPGTSVEEEDGWWIVKRYGETIAKLSGQYFPRCS